MEWCPSRNFSLLALVGWGSAMLKKRMMTMLNEFHQACYMHHHMPKILHPGSRNRRRKQCALNSDVNQSISLFGLIIFVQIDLQTLSFWLFINMLDMLIYFSCVGIPLMPSFLEALLNCPAYASCLTMSMGYGLYNHVSELLLQRTRSLYISILLKKLEPCILPIFVFCMDEENWCTPQQNKETQ